jgi:Fe2+ transport system protein FeoA
MSSNASKSLPDLAPGEQGTVQTLNSGAAFVSRMAAMGLSPGAKVIVTQNFLKRPLIVMVRNTFIALSRLEAGWIQIEQAGK